MLTSMPRIKFVLCTINYNFIFICKRIQLNNIRIFPVHIVVEYRNFSVFVPVWIMLSACQSLPPPLHFKRVRIHNENQIGRTQAYEALRQRLSSVFNAGTNPTGVKIYLEEVSADPVELLADIGRKLATIYEVAYSTKFETSALNETIADIAKAAYERKLEIGYKREFVKNLIKALHKLRKTG